MGMSPIFIFNNTVRKVLAEIDFAGCETKGERESQQDYYAISFPDMQSNKKMLCVLADGMGGHVGGSIASKLAVHGFVDAFIQTDSPSGVRGQMSAALAYANREISLKINDNPELDGMGTTLVGVYLSPSALHWISVGDSPLYLYSNRYLQRLNADHSMQPMVDDQWRAGEISKEYMDAHPERNMLRSVLSGMKIDMVDVGVYPSKLSPDDILLISSDGLQTLDDYEIRKIVHSNFQCDATVIASMLRDSVLSKKKPRQDNIAIIVVKISALLNPNPDDS